MGTQTIEEVQLIADLAALSAAIRSGVRKVRLNNREQEFQSVSQMLLAKKDLQAELSACQEANGTKVRRPRAYRASLNKGL